jgi:hypothetical protein
MRATLPLLTVLGTMLFAACGASSKQTAPPKEEHGDLPPAVHAFHELLAPLWHADPGDQRTNDTCAKLEDMRQRAADIVVAEPPAAASADQAGYRDAASALVHAVVELGDACSADGRAGFTERFAAVHDSFHAVMEKASPPAPGK